MRNLWHWLVVLLIGCATEAGPVGECNPSLGSCYASKPCDDAEMCEVLLARTYTALMQSLAMTSRCARTMGNASRLATPAS